MWSFRLLLAPSASVRVVALRFLSWRLYEIESHFLCAHTHIQAKDTHVCLEQVKSLRKGLLPLALVVWDLNKKDNIRLFYKNLNKICFRSVYIVDNYAF